MSDYDPVIDAEIAILRAEVAKLKVDNAEWLRMSQRKDQIIDGQIKEINELRAKNARLEADLLDEQLRHGQTAKVAREEVARLKAERDVQGR